MRVLPIVSLLALAVASTTASSHGRPPMLWKIKSISAKHMQIFGPNDEGEGHAINNLGSMVGWARSSPGGLRRAFKRDLLGATTNLGALAPEKDTLAHDINENSEVVGYSGLGNSARGFYWSLGEGLVNLSSVNPDGVSGPRGYFAFGINNNSRIVGRASTSTGSYQGAAMTWWYHGADPAWINPLPAGMANWAWDLSDSGWMAGEEFVMASADNYGFRYRWGTVDYPVDPSPDRKAEHVYGVNEAGTVVGDAWWACCGSRAVRWRMNGDPLVMGVLPGGDHAAAYEINEQEFAVGWSNTMIGGVKSERGFLFHIELGTVIALPVPEGFPDTYATKCSANGLNDLKANGLIQIAGTCTLDGKQKVVRWDVFVEEIPES